MKYQLNRRSFLKTAGAFGAGISLGGIPMPNAWLGNMKNVNLVGEFGTEDGFWAIFSEGIRSIKVREGSLQITLKE